MTLHIDESINRIVDSSNMLSKEQKALFCALFHELAQEQETLFAAIENDVRSEENSAEWATEKWETVTALVPRKDLIHAQMQGLFPMLPEEDLPAVEERTEDQRQIRELGKNGWYAGYAFLYCAWADTEKYCNTAYRARLTTVTGEARDIPYHLRPRYFLLERERILEETGSQYGVMRPYVLSPFSRRLVQVQLDDPQVDPDNIKKIDLDFTGNCLTDVLVTDRMPVWNLAILERERCRLPSETPPVVPEGGQTYVKYLFETPGHFLYIDRLDEDAVVHRGRESVRVQTLLRPGEGPPYQNWDYQQIRLHAVGSVPDTYWLFRNRICPEITAALRVRTRGDVQRVVERFCPPGLRFLDVNDRLTSEQAIRTYNKASAYRYFPAQWLRKQSVLYLRFEPEPGQELFFTDLVSYLLAFLNSQYPEYQWAGEE